MATTIKLKNGSGAPAASDLVQGEPAIDLTNKRLYTEDSSGNVIEVGSNPSSLSINGTAVTATAAEINTLDGITSSTAELNILDGVTSTAAELNILDGVTATTAEINILDGVTSTTAELNILDGVTSTTAELNILDGVTATTAELNILDGVTSTTAELNILDGVTSTAAELNILDGVTSTAAELNILDGVTSSTAELNILDGVTSTTAELNILDGVTATAAELNVLDGVTAFVDEDNMSSNSATSIPSQQSVKAYVDSQVTAQDLDFQADSGGALSIDLDSETLTFTGGTGIDTSGSGNAVTFAVDSTVATLAGSQTFTNKTLTSPDINTPDIDGGTIDGTVIGGSSAAAGTFSALVANSLTYPTSDGNNGQAIITNGNGTLSFGDVSGGGGITYVTKTANYTMSAGEGVIANTAGGTFTLTLPASPSTGDQVIIADGSNWATTNLTVGRNGSTIEGVASDLTCNVEGISVTMVYDGSTWQLYPQTGTSPSLGIDDNATSTAVTIASDGDVGIGTTSPSHKLDVTGGATDVSMRVGPTGSSGDNDGTLIINNGGTGDAMLRFDYEGNTDRARIGVSASGQQLEFYTAGNNERMRILSGGGITFNGDTATANALNDYEEGTWTPTVTGHGGGSTQSYSTQSGVYRKIGNLVYATCRVTMTSKGNMSGNYVLLQGWPFAFGGTATTAGYGGVNYFSGLSTQVWSLFWELGGGGTTSGWLSFAGDGATASSYMPVSGINDSFYFHCSAVYYTS